MKSINDLAILSVKISTCRLTLAMAIKNYCITKVHSLKLSSENLLTHWFLLDSLPFDQPYVRSYQFFSSYETLPSPIGPYVQTLIYEQSYKKWTLVTR